MDSSNLNSYVYAYYLSKDWAGFGDKEEYHTDIKLFRSFENALHCSIEEFKEATEYGDEDDEDDEYLDEFILSIRTKGYFRTSYNEIFIIKPVLIQK